MIDRESLPSKHASAHRPHRVHRIHPAATRRPAVALAFLAAALAAGAQPFLLPTPNRALFDPAGPEDYFVGTVGRTWTSGIFGCVRSEGFQFHEGLDIRSVQRDDRGEPADPIATVADGRIAYVNRRPGTSNYGNYVVIRHEIEGMPVFSVYAHLSRIRDEVRPGLIVRAGQIVAVMGRTANTKQEISKERAHLHFELTLQLTDRYDQWFQDRYPKGRNDHGDWNGQAFIGLDPWLVLVAPYQHFGPFSLTALIRQEIELCRVVVRADDFPWLRLYPQLVLPNPRASQEGIAGYEIALNYAGLPFEMIPRAPSEIPDRAPIQLVSVNQEIQQNYPCRKLVSRQNGRWELAAAGKRLLDVLTFH